MDQDDPEKRIAEWQRQVAEQKRMAGLYSQQADAVGQEPAFPDDRTAAGRDSASDPGQSRWERLKNWLGVIAAVGLWLFLIGYLAYEFVAYYAGTPTTATIHECTHARGWRCTASWSVGGQSHTGTVSVEHDYPPASSVDVRDFAGVAYTSPPWIAIGGRHRVPASDLLPVIFIVIGAIAACAGVGGVVWRRWWRRRTGPESDHTQSHPDSSPGLTQGRFVAKLWRVTVGVRVYGFVVFAAMPALIYAGHAKLAPIAVLFLAAGGLVALYAYLIYRMLRKIHICVTSDGLTLDHRPGKVFSFSDAKLGQWTPTASAATMPGSGSALHLRCGPHRFILGGRDHRIAEGPRLDAASVGSVDAVMSAADFDELLTMIGRRSGLDVRQPAPEEPIRCLLVPSPSGSAAAGFVRIMGATLGATRTRNPSLAIDVGKDAISVIDANTNALIASARLAEVTATPADWKWEFRTPPTPVLVLCVPGLQPLTIGCPILHSWSSRFSWSGRVPSAKKPAFVVSETDWLTFAEKFGLASYLQDQGERQWGVKD